MINTMAAIGPNAVPINGDKPRGNPGVAASEIYKIATGAPLGKDYWMGRVEGPSPLRERDFVTMAVVAGVQPWAIMWRHIFPNVINTVLIIVSLLVGQTILLEASLSFLGVGVPPGTAAWGIMVAEGRDSLVDLWYLSLLPGLAITVVVIAMNLFGDWLRDTLDPKLRRA